MTSCTDISSVEEEILSESSATNRLYQSDTFESTSLDDFSSTYSTTTSLRRDPPTFTCNTRDMKERAYIDTSSLVSEHCSRTHSLVGAEVFLTQKLELLQAKLHTTKTQTNSKTLTQASTLGSLPLSISENTYIKACLNRLKSVPVDNNTDCSRVSYRRVDTTLDNGMVRVFSRQCERLKRESLKSRMKSEIKKEIDRGKELSQVVSSPRMRDLQHDMARKEFVYHKLKLLTQTDFGDQLDKHLYLRDTLSLLGDIVGSCVRPSAPSSDVWRAIDDRIRQMQGACQENYKIMNSVGDY